MQNKPYDSSRYLDGGNNVSASGGMSNGSQFVPRQENNNRQDNYMTMNAQLVPQQQHQGSFHDQSSFPSVNSIPVDSRMNRFQQDTLIMTQHSNRSYHNSRSPINNNIRKYPPHPLPPNNPNYPHPSDTALPFTPNQTIYSNSQRSVSPMNSRNRSLNRTQQSPFNHNQSMKNISYQNNSMAMTGSLLGHNSNFNSGTLKIHVHELLGKDLDLGDCLLRVYVNN